MAETRAQAIARRQRERRALEDQEQARRSAAKAPDYAQRAGGGLAGRAREAVLQADTAMRSAANALTFGGANTLAAGLDALAPVEGEGLRQRYLDSVAAETARTNMMRSIAPRRGRWGQTRRLCLACLAAALRLQASLSRAPRSDRRRRRPPFWGLAVFRGWRSKAQRTLLRIAAPIGVTGWEQPPVAFSGRRSAAWTGTCDRHPVRGHHGGAGPASRPHDIAGGPGPERCGGTSGRRDRGGGGTGLVRGPIA